VKVYVAFLCALSVGVSAQSIPSIPAAQLKSGTHFQSQTLRTQQADDAQNPGMLWVELGKKQFDADCARCHADANTLALKLPRAKGDAAENLDDAINGCIETKLKRPRLVAESQLLLGLNAYLMHSARGSTREIAETAPQGSTSQAWKSGRATWFARQGKQDLSCALCHDGLWGKTLRNQTISQGHTVGYPTYRQEWQTLGSAERRIRACYFGMEAEVPPAGSSSLRALELYSAWRGRSLPIEAPAVRR
jgi:L-cysteine S-thiosulfotransferase